MCRMFTNTKVLWSNNGSLYMYRAVRKVYGVCVFSRYCVYTSMSNIKSKSSRQLSNKCHRPSICFRILDTVLLRLCIQYTSLLYGGRFSIFNCISASLFLFPTSSTFTTVHTRTHTRGCYVWDLHWAKVISFIPTRWGWWTTGGGEGYFPGFRSFFSWYIDRSIRRVLSILY